MGSGLSQEAADTQQSDVSPPTTTTSSKAHENHHNTTRSNNLPHEVEAILKDADTDIDKSSIDKLYAGVFLNKKRKKYWVDKESNGNCFMMFARDLSITWGDDTRYWYWPSIKETSEVVLDVAELLNVCWLEVKGKFEISKLTPGIKYEVVFVLMLKDPAYGWEVPIDITLVLPDGTKQEHQENMMEKPRSKWFEIPVGEFMVTKQEHKEHMMEKPRSKWFEIPEGEFMVEAKKGGFVEFSMFKCGAWKSGLVVKGAAIRPKN